MAQEEKFDGAVNESRESRAWPLFLILIFLLVGTTTTWRLFSTWDSWTTLGFDFTIRDKKIFSVLPGSEANLAGIRAGDQIVSIDDVKFLLPNGQIRLYSSLSEERRFLELYEAGNILTITVRRINSTDHPDHPGEQFIVAKIPVIKIPYRRFFSFFPWLGTLLAALGGCRGSH